MTTNPSKTALLGAMFLSALLVASLTLGAALPRQRPDDDDDEAKEIGRRAFVENCLICHGDDMTTRQRLTAKQWTAEVEKMVGWGAPVPADQRENLLAYLVSTYSDKTPSLPPVLAPADDLLRAQAPPPISHKGDSARGGPLYAQFCATCHGKDGQGGDLGPRLVERGVLLRDSAYHDAVRKGVRRMPSFSTVLKPEGEDDILAWLRSRHGD
jgi:mono/diheme cytochrome c family protein